jgi:hypothetical protein
MDATHCEHRREQPMISVTLATSDVVRYFVFPVAVLLSGIVVTGLLIPELTKRRDNRRKALEIKTQLVSDMSEAVMAFVMAIQFSVLGAVGQDQKEYDDAYKQWEKERSVIGTKLEAYFPKTDIGSAWSEFAHRVTNFYALTGIPEPEVRRSQTTVLLKTYGLNWPEQQARSDDENENWKVAWGLVREAILEEKKQLIQRALHERATAVEPKTYRLRAVRNFLHL